MTLVVISCLLSLAFLVRILPHQLVFGELGVDHWFWKAYTETYLEKRQFPPNLPQYLLDKHQWYPPLFPLLISHLPKSIFNRYSPWLAIGIDMLRMALLLGVAHWISNGDLYVISIAGLIYATTPVLISYNVQLNPRGLGALFLDGLIVLVLWFYLHDSPVWIWILVLLLSGLILLTHKMTTQLFWFLCFASGLLMMDWRLLALIPASILTALLISKGFYWNVMRAHWDIVTFWNRNWRWLQAHPIKESPIYGEKDYETPTKFHRKGMAGVLRHTRYLLGYNPWVWILCVLSAGTLHVVVRDWGLSPWVFWWMVLTLLFVVSTVFVPFMKCLGSGYFYLYNAAFPAALLWGIVISGNNEGIFIWYGFLIALATSLLAIFLFYRNLKFSKTQKIDYDFENLLDYLKASSKGTVMCLPPQWYDAVAYKTGQPVLWGGHGYGFKLLELIFPRLLLSMQEILSRYNVRYLVTLDGYLPQNFIADLACKSSLDFGPYRIFCWWSYL